MTSRHSHQTTCCYSSLNQAFPQGVQEDDVYSRRRRKQSQYLAALFWSRWTREYLPLLRERQTWTTPRKHFQPGDVLFIVDDSAPRNSWVMGRVLKTMSDANGSVCSPPSQLGAGHVGAIR
ncbi:hypothetical protein CgunFtcFv8_004875 [Champsocephalus gunnari]|uniref:DUF5641 domain-containing protein n=1 Tax=Champsocephalus gunnari TaxID=52237 RepID=A0AAN8E1Z3_CHAGU|nr:hypothetical protein CgunFtcFv8_004875 [Champsocephalus gunnari]